MPDKLYNMTIRLMDTGLPTHQKKKPRKMQKNGHRVSPIKKTVWSSI